MANGNIRKSDQIFKTVDTESIRYCDVVGPEQEILRFGMPTEEKRKGGGGERNNRRVVNFCIGSATLEIFSEAREIKF